MEDGRPRTTTPEKEELIKLGEELVLWATEKTKELRYHLNQWWCLEKGFTQNEWDLMCAKKEFKVFIAKARVAISKRYVDGSINSSIAHRFLRLYFPELKEEENATKKYDAELRNMTPENARELLIKVIDYSKKNGLIEE